MRFTFKTEKSTGAYRSFHPNTHLIKFKKVVVGSIDDKAPHKIRLQIMKEKDHDDGNPNCDWMNITLKNEFKSVYDAKKYLNEYIYRIMEQFKLKSNG